MSKTITLDANRCFEAELLGKDLASWLEAPDGTGWNPRFGAVEDWQEWWEDSGANFLARSRDLYEFFARERQEANIDPTEGDLGPAPDEADRFGLGPRRG